MFRLSAIYNWMFTVPYVLIILNEMKLLLESVYLKLSFIFVGVILVRCVAKSDLDQFSFFDPIYHFLSKFVQ